MMKQRKITKNLGVDTHVRSNVDNIFTPGNNQSNQLIVGEVLYPEPEPLFRQNYVTVKLARGGQISTVAMPNAFISPITKNLHGLYEGLSPGQQVLVGFENGNQASPFIANRYPYQGVGNSLFEAGYTLPTVLAGIGNLDVRLGHITGSYLSFNSGVFPNIDIPGSVSLSAVTNLDMSSNLLTTISGLSSTMTSTLGATVSCGITGLVEISNLVQNMGTLIQTLYTILTAIDAAVPAGQAATIAAEKVKWALLLK